MTKTEFNSIFRKLDRSKFSAYEHGIAFELVAKNLKTGEMMHAGIGNGGEMAEMIVFSILSLYDTACDGTNIEEFAESVKQNVLKAYEMNIFKMQHTDTAPEAGNDAVTSIEADSEGEG